MTSDDFFSELSENDMFDVIFIDGLHLDHQVNKDIENGLKHLKEGGTILLHDCNPPTKYHAAESPVYSEPANGDWNGTVYLSLINLRLYRNNLRLRTVDSDWGVGILTRETSETLNAFPNDAMSWEFFYENKQEILDLITVEEFINLYPVDLLIG
jgi:SAM-dependent methyltransferase